MDSFNNYEQAKSDYAVLEPFLNREEVLWMGHPSDKSSRPLGSMIYLGVFSVFWLSFAIFWTITASTAGGFFGLFGIPFVAVGCWMVYSVFFGYKKIASTTYYAVTPRRALIVTVRKSGTNCTEHLFANLPGVQLTEVKGTRGTILFSLYPPNFNRGYYRRGISMNEFSGGDWTIAFRSIDNVQHVYQIIYDQIAANGSDKE
ncbi:MAG: hypothetical protein E7666_05585 [Ruminococcaceae bacterium]|nr:hypothetical protein [Oscillospiraceae bacterium]